MEFVAYCDGRRLTLTGRELALLTELAWRCNRIVSREELYLAVWGRALRCGDRSVDVYVRKLRVLGAFTGSSQRGDKRVTDSVAPCDRVATCTQRRLSPRWSRVWP